MVQIIANANPAAVGSETNSESSTILCAVPQFFADRVFQISRYAGVRRKGNVSPPPFVDHPEL